MNQDAEARALREQLGQLAADLQRSTAALAAKDAEAATLAATSDRLRALLADKDALFAEFQVQVQALEQHAAAERQRAAAREAELQRAAAERDAELGALRAAIAAEERWSGRLTAARQAALDESAARGGQAAALERAAEGGELRRQAEALAAALGVKEAELDAAHRQLAAALRSSEAAAELHTKTAAANAELIARLQRQLDAQGAGASEAAAEHDGNMAKLVGSLGELRGTCQAQAAEVAEHAAAAARLQQERAALRAQLHAQDEIITKLQTEKGVLEAALQHEVSAQAGAQAQLSIVQAKLGEAVAELERRCGGTRAGGGRECRPWRSRIGGGRSRVHPGPWPAAAGAAAAEARCVQLMAQLVDARRRLVDAVVDPASSCSPQLAAELASSLEAERQRTQSELSAAQERAKSLAEDLGIVRTLLPLASPPGGAPAGNGSLSALAQVLAQRDQQRQAAQQHPGLEHHAAAARGSPDRQPSPAWPRERSPDRARAGGGGCGGGPGTLAGLVCELQADVGRLRQQLHRSRRQQQARAGPQQGSACGSPARQAPGGACGASPDRASGACAAAEEAGGMAGALRHLLLRTERLSAENGALKVMVSGGSPARAGRSRRDPGRGSVESDDGAGEPPGAARRRGGSAERQLRRVAPGSPGPELRACSSPEPSAAQLAHAAPRGSGLELLERVLASWPADPRLLTELIAAAGAARLRGGPGGASPARAALAREQLRRLAALSPTRSRLLRALAGGPEELVWAKVPGWQWWPARTLDDAGTASRAARGSRGGSREATPQRSRGGAAGSREATPQRSRGGGGGGSREATPQRTTQREQVVLFLGDRTVARVPPNPPPFGEHYARFVPSTYGNKKLFQAVEEGRALLADGAEGGTPLLPYPPPVREDLKRGGRQLLAWLRHAAVEPAAATNKLSDQANKRVLHAVRNNRSVAEDMRPVLLAPEGQAAGGVAAGDAAAALALDDAARLPKRQRKQQSWLQLLGGRGSREAAATLAAVPDEAGGARLPPGAPRQPATGGGGGGHLAQLRQQQLERMRQQLDHAGGRPAAGGALGAGGGGRSGAGRERKRTALALAAEEAAVDSDSDGAGFSGSDEEGPSSEEAGLSGLSQDESSDGELEGGATPRRRQRGGWPALRTTPPPKRRRVAGARPGARRGPGAAWDAAGADSSGNDRREESGGRRRAEALHRLDGLGPHGSDGGASDGASSDDGGGAAAQRRGRRHGSSCSQRQRAADAAAAAAAAAAAVAAAFGGEPRNASGSAFAAALAGAARLRAHSAAAGSACTCAGAGLMAALCPRCVSSPALLGGASAGGAAPPSRLRLPGAAPHRWRAPGAGGGAPALLAGGSGGCSSNSMDHMEHCLALLGDDESEQMQQRRPPPPPALELEEHSLVELGGLAPEGLLSPFGCAQVDLGGGPPLPRAAAAAQSSGASGGSAGAATTAVCLGAGGPRPPSPLPGAADIAAAAPHVGAELLPTLEEDLRHAAAMFGPADAPASPARDACTLHNSHSWQARHMELLTLQQHGGAGAGAAAPAAAGSAHSGSRPAGGGAASHPDSPCSCSHAALALGDWERGGWREGPHGDSAGGAHDLAGRALRAAAQRAAPAPAPAPGSATGGLIPDGDAASGGRKLPVLDLQGQLTAARRDNKSLRHQLASANSHLTRQAKQLQQQAGELMALRALVAQLQRKRVAPAAAAGRKRAAAEGPAAPSAAEPAAPGAAAGGEPGAAAPGAVDPPGSGRGRGRGRGGRGRGRGGRWGARPSEAAVGVQPAPAAPAAAAPPPASAAGQEPAGAAQPADTATGDAAQQQQQQQQQLVVQVKQEVQPGAPIGDAVAVVPGGARGGLGLGRGRGRGRRGGGGGRSAGRGTLAKLAHAGAAPAATAGPAADVVQGQADQGAQAAAPSAAEVFARRPLGLQLQSPAVTAQALAAAVAALTGAQQQQAGGATASAASAQTAAPAAPAPAGGLFALAGAHGALGLMLQGSPPTLLPLSALSSLMASVPAAFAARPLPAAAPVAAPGAQELAASAAPGVAAAAAP
ncbi:hypothetical protein HT031_002383 [Scenedesmus sp. PABB004]|nr:hypothetical protein HT031_002383 [Scenedesmus sp. PABB004]